LGASEYLVCIVSAHQGRKPRGLELHVALFIRSGSRGKSGSV